MLDDLIVVPFERSFDAAYGLEYVSAGEGEARGRLPVTAALNSGIYAAAAESLASTGTAAEVIPQGLIPSGLSNSTHVLAPARDGVLDVTARCRARGSLDWLWDVEAVLDGEVCAVSAVVIAVRPARS